MIPFPGRAALVSEAQRALGLLVDGKDGRMTWHALGTRFLPTGHPAMRGITPTPGPRDFLGRSGIVAAIQSACGADVDGRDGSQTWSAIMEGLIPLHAAPKSTIPLGDTFIERTRGRSPNRNPGTNECKGIVFHHAAGHFEGTISWCLKSRTFAAYHCLIDTDGTRAILGHDTDRLHHAGRSSFKGRASCNNFMLGIAFIGNTNTGAMRPNRNLTDKELASAKEWVMAKMRAYHIPKDWITHHRLVSPGRKDDLSLAAWKQVRESLDLP